MLHRVLVYLFNGFITKNKIITYLVSLLIEERLKRQIFLYSEIASNI